MATVSIQGRTIQDPTFLAKIFSSPKAAWFWLLLRVWLGYQWIEASLHKVTDPGWVQTGESLMGFWTRAASIPAEGRPPIAFDWYRSFIQFLLDTQSYTWFAKLVAYREMLIGIALIVGAFTGVAAFFGALHELEFHDGRLGQHQSMAVRTGPGHLGCLEDRGYIGFDYFLFPMLSRHFTKSKEPARVAQPAIGR